MRSLEEKAKAALQGGKRNVFISFATEDMDEVNLLRAQAKNENSDIEFNDHSVREPYESERAEYIKRKIAERIARSSVTVVYLSKDTAQSRWVEWEVKKSLELGKKVIAVHPGDSFKGSRPSWLDQHRIEVVPWSRLGDRLK
ncbi:TIR domain-containing protein [Paraburkholderia kururiensis]|uniref:TIR domain-containing protein n=1 Tax=Paraburkholderia kururiensis TaxID=984307 RepID=A0ABZ0WDU5_9BURK|nr:TIR domain-containing protein [Paraburkholderia kururiensis]WQD75482.1 TIR domain-containing protein [Paraburkholderia kururiensis]